MDSFSPISFTLLCQYQLPSSSHYRIIYRPGLESNTLPITDESSFARTCADGILAADVVMLKPSGLSLTASTRKALKQQALLLSHL